MADSKGSALGQITTIAGTDGIYVVDDLAGTPVSKIITKANFEDDLAVTVSQVSDLTATAVELNYVDGVTSAIQTQLDTKAATADVALSKSYASTGQTITSAALLTLAHGLGVEPAMVLYVLECTSNDAGYSTGDRITIGFSSTSVAITRGNTARLDATNIKIRLNDAINVFVAQKKSTGEASVLTNASWDLYVRAYA